VALVEHPEEAEIWCKTPDNVGVFATHIEQQSLSSSGPCLSVLCTKEL
jgi:hypothetical protein